MRRFLAAVIPLLVVGNEEIILVYPFHGCSYTEAVGDVSFMSYNPRRHPREFALAELNRRIGLRRRRLDDRQGGGMMMMANNDDHDDAIIPSHAPAPSRFLGALQMEVITIPSMDDEELKELTYDLPCVEFVEKDSLRKYDQTSYDQQGRRNLLPNDSLYSKQWHLHSYEPWGTQAQDTLNNNDLAEQVIVAVIDSGCDLNHPDLSSRRWRNENEICGDGIDNDGNGYIDDCYGWDWVDKDNDPSPALGSGHGTAAAGIIGAESGNSIGIAGLCESCRIMCLRFINASEGKVSDQVSAIDYAARMGARISNNSYGGYGFSNLEYEVIRRARTYGHLFISSAGNNGHNTDLPQYEHTPSVYNLDNILAVGASTPTGTKATFSNYGISTVDIFAPGTKIVTTETGGGYSVVSGTSFAAPMAAGAAGLLWSHFPDLTYIQIIELLIQNCKQSVALASKYNTHQTQALV